MYGQKWNQRVIPATRAIEAGCLSVSKVESPLTRCFIHWRISLVWFLDNDVPGLLLAGLTALSTTIQERDSMVTIDACYACQNRSGLATTTGPSLLHRMASI